LNRRVQGQRSQRYSGIPFIAMTASNSQLTATNRAALRQTLRAQRRQVSVQQQQTAARQLCTRLIRLPAFWRSQSIAAYWASDGEVDLQPLIVAAWRAGKQIFLPVVSGKYSMEFRHYQRGDSLRRNRFGIAEPRPAAALAELSELNLVIAPLVGFDRNGNRLGMGGGFYDRALCRINRRRCGPLLIGAAHSSQQVTALTPTAWDQPLQAVVTEREYIRCAS
jgi:5-formyltetrahydrofolate cyclo-ligase